MADREEKWSIFVAAPQWLKKRGESEQDGPLLSSFSNSFLQPTAFSVLKQV